MGSTTKFGWDYGVQAQNPWFTKWSGIFEAIDGKLYGVKQKTNAWVDVVSYMDGQSGRPTYATWFANQATTNVDAVFVAALAVGGKIVVPDATYMIGATTQWLAVLSNTEIVMGRNAILSFEGTDATYRNGFRLNGVSNVKISGGILKGNRATQSSGMGVGIYITNGSHDVLIDSVYAQDWYYDSFLVASGAADSYNITLRNCTSYNARRNGGTVGRAYDVLIDGCTFDTTNGTSPQVGLDIEPDAGEVAKRIKVVNCTFKNNTSHGAYIQKGAGTTKDIIFSNNKSYSNGGFGVAVVGISKAVVSNNLVEGNTGGGIEFQEVSFSDLMGNVIDSNGTSGANNLEINKSVDLSILGNNILNSAVADCAGVIVRSVGGVTCDRIVFKGNTIKDSQYSGLELSGVTDSIFSGNIISGSQLSGIIAGSPNTVDDSIIANNIVKDNNQAAGNNDGIQVLLTTRAHVSGNKVKGDHRYGMIITSDATDPSITDNDLIGSSSYTPGTGYEISDSGVGTTKYGNRLIGGAVNGQTDLTTGSATVSTTEVLTGDRILLTNILVSGTAGVLSVGTITNKTSFVINSTEGSDASTVYWEIRH